MKLFVDPRTDNMYGYYVYYEIVTRYAPDNTATQIVQLTRKHKHPNVQIGCSTHAITDAHVIRTDLPIEIIITPPQATSSRFYERRNRHR